MTRDEAIDVLRMVTIMECDEERADEAIDMAIEALEEQPVKCRECTYIKEAGGHANCDGYLLCRKWHIAVDAEDYCSWGEHEV